MLLGTIRLLWSSDHLMQVQIAVHDTCSAIVMEVHLHKNSCSELPCQAGVNRACPAAFSELTEFKFRRDSLSDRYQECRR